MSRYSSKTANGLSVTYGFDHACGYFLQVFDNNVNNDEPIIDVDSLFDGLSGIHLMERLKEFASCPISLISVGSEREQSVILSGV